jgi:S1-C subfamily serine protease
MQPMDDQPIRQSDNEPSTTEQPAQGSYERGTFGQSVPAQEAYIPTLPMPGPSGQPHTAFQQPDMHATTPVAPPGMSAAPASVRSQRSGLRTGALLGLTALLALVFAVGLFAGWQFGHGGSPSPSGSSILQPGNTPSVVVPPLTNNNVDAVREAVISKVQPSVVQINVTTQAARALGSGVIIDKRGYIVTNNHVVSNASSIQVTLSNNTRFPAQVVGTDPADDLAVIKITPPASGLTTITLGDSSQLRVGQDVLAIGSPLGNAETVTSGIISALNRNVSEGTNQPTLPDAIQTDAPINPGNSGGALVDMQGRLIGMPTLNAVNTEFNTPANGLGFAIPVNRINFIAQQIISTGHVTHTGRAILGVTVTDVNSSVAQQNQLSVTSGALIVSVVAGDPASSAGLKTGDVIVQLGDKPIYSTADLSAALLQHKPGDTVAVKIYRGSQQLTINVTLGELPASS